LERKEREKKKRKGKETPQSNPAPNTVCLCMLTMCHLLISALWSPPFLFVLLSAVSFFSTFY
jgi:hypothetical protein